MPKIKIQQYPRRDDFLAEESLFPKPAKSISDKMLDTAIVAAFERCLKDKRGNLTELPKTSEALIALCIAHLKQRSDPVLSPYFLSQCELEEIFELDAISHEMQRLRMKIGVFYQYLIIELLRLQFKNVADGKREGDVEVEIEPPGFKKGLRLYISVKKSSDTVGGQDVGGMIRRLEGMAFEDKNLTRPYLCVVCIATPSRGIILPYERGRTIRRNRDGYPYSPNCEVWSPGFVFPYISGLEAQVVYRAALHRIGNYLPFYSLSLRQECGKLLAEELKHLNLVDSKTGRLDAEKFLAFVSEKKEVNELLQTADEI